MKKTITQAILALSLVFSAPYMQAQWIQTNLTSTDDPICLASAGSIIFAGTANQGVEVSTDHGTTWTMVNTGLTNTNVTCLAVSGSNIFAGTNIFGSSSAGVFMAATSAPSWTHTSTGLPDTTISCLGINGKNIFTGIGNDKAFLSTNNGAAWSGVSNGLTPGNLIDGFAFTTTNSFVATGGAGIYTSTNNGTSWALVNNGLNNLNIGAMAVNGSRVFAGSGQGMYYSDNNGATWTIDTAGMGNGTLSFNSILTIGNKIFAGSIYSGVYYSSNNGMNWTAANAGLTNMQVVGLASDGTYLYAAQSYSGLWKRPLTDFTSTTSITEIKEPLNLNVYPNPASNNFVVETNTTVKQTLQVFDVTGKLILTEMLLNRRSNIDVNNLTPGIYNICLTSNEEKINKRLVIVK